MKISNSFHALILHGGKANPKERKTILIFYFPCVRTYLVLGERSECVIIILSCVVGSWLDASEGTFFPMDDLEAPLPLLPSGYLARSVQHRGSCCFPRPTNDHKEIQGLSVIKCSGT